MIDRPTARELQVLGLVAQGLRARDIASRLDISIYTAKTHLERARRRLRARSTAHAVAIAYERGWLSAGAADAIDDVVVSEVSVLHAELGRTLARLNEYKGEWA